MGNQNARTRFAPSPTGFLHVGSVRTALFCWLLARKHDGSFILRIEDTDQKRQVSGAVEHVLDSLKWLGIEPDEGIEKAGKYGPYLQSERKEIYKKYANELVKTGQAYVDPYTKEELDSLREKAKKTDRLFRYRNHRPENPPKYDGSQPLRFRIPDNLSISWDDAVREEVSFATKDLDDFIILKSDGFPTYNFANVIDDHLMHITHVLRGEEFVSSTPLHLLLYRAFNWDHPIFAHLPQVKAKGGKKLSKRHDAASITEYRSQGYTPEALVNFLVLLGWNDGTEQEVYSKKELIDAFELNDINPSPAIFDQTKLNWINGEYLKKLTFAEKLEYASEFWPEEADGYDGKYKESVLRLVDERIQYFGELPELTSFFFSSPNVSQSDLATKKINKAEVQELLNSTIDRLEGIASFNRDNIEKALRNLVKEKETKPGILFPLIRVAVTGTRSSPPLFDTINVLGRQTALNRLRKLIT